ncbi:NAD(P)H-binding protein [Paenibacillus pasadenensis]|uniref:NAD(P)H-binding protein n=1 Tax=Paenibacillus pasadenensis TaxID=217090 RepID=UPI00203F076A|nr:NAD(P)H-binding protein [Paenibacillus pasadenensis]MCM3745788.1 NAD(P)H-binding protein [Paenibacillus pasadenensis]
MRPNDLNHLAHKRKVVALTGATGYIGGNLMKQLKKDASIIALSRHADASQNTENVQWRSCDFFSQEQAVEALKGADTAIYLIHSMLPSAKLTQGGFEDMDAILAAHFARAAAFNGVRQIIYLSGIVPEGIPEKNLSRHLRSRLEVERILGSYGVPVTTLRAGLIVGPEGSSYPILSRLVRRLPIMVLPSWTNNKTDPVALADVLDTICNVIGREEVMGRTIDIGGPQPMSYKELLRQTADLLGVRRIMIPFPFPTVKLSRLWISLITGAPKEMVYPLVESLAHPMTAQNTAEVNGIDRGAISYQAAARFALEQASSKSTRKRTKAAHSSRRQDVRSVQRFVLPPGKDADWAGRHYLDWLGSAFKPFVYTQRVGEDKVLVHVRPLPQPVLELQYDRELSTLYRSVFRITGGRFALTENAHHGRLEFLQLPESQQCLAGIHDYMPSLPWLLYKYGQAKIHLVVMNAYGRRLKKLVFENKIKQHEEKHG